MADLRDRPAPRALGSALTRALPATLTLLGCWGATSVPGAQDGRPSFRWDADRAEHLLNRAGFGAAPEEVERAVALGHRRFVEELLAGEPYLDEPFYARLRGAGREEAPGEFGAMGPMSSMAGGSGDSMEDAESRKRRNEIRREDGQQLRDYMAWWVERMIDGDDPLRERMTLFWHGHFTSSMRDVRNSHEMIVQNQLLRRNALGSFRELVHGIARDPAMLEYLDNDSNRAGSPNENFARELMELFTLGEGNYTEEDIKEAARAFTGWTDREGEFVFVSRRHDYGVKTVLGVTGRLDGDDVIEILLEHESCPRYLAGKLIAYLEGVAPSEARLDHYAARMRALDFEIGPFLAELFADEAFYRDQVRGTRIAGPVDYIVGCARRLAVEPPSELVLTGATMLGQRLFYPPNVKGWEGGASWITTSTLMHRGNLSGVLLGQVELEDFLADADAMPAEVGSAADYEAEDGMASDDVDTGRRRRVGTRDRTLRDLKNLERRQWRPRLNLSAALRRVGAKSDREVVNELTSRLLACPLDAGARESLARTLARDRRSLGIPEGEILDYGLDSEELLRSFAHLVLSLPEAQLH